MHGHVVTSLSLRELSGAFYKIFQSVPKKGQASPVLVLSAVHNGLYLFITWSPMHNAIDRLAMLGYSPDAWTS